MKMFLKKQNTKETTNKKQQQQKVFAQYFLFKMPSE